MLKRSLFLLPLAVVAVSGDYVFPEPDGPFRVTMTSEELVDQARPDPFNSSHPRRLMISRFTPVPRKQCQKTCLVQYMPEVVAREEDANLLAFLKTDEWPVGILSQLQLQLCCEVRPRCKKKSYPTLLLGTGLNTTRLFYSAMAKNIASTGYEVIAMDHPYETDIVQFPDGTVIYGGNVPADKNNTGPLIHALDARLRDASFILNELGVQYTTDNPSNSKAGFVGHSFGGAAAAHTMLNDTRVVAGINFDGLMFGPVLNAGLGRPGIPQSFLLWGSEGHNSTVDTAWDQLWKTHDSYHPGEWMKELGMKGSVHGSFWDMVLIADVAGLRENPPLYGEVTGARVMEILRAYLRDYFGMALTGKGEGLLAGPDSKYSEVVFVR